MQHHEHSSIPLFDTIIIVYCIHCPTVTLGLRPVNTKDDDYKDNGEDIG